MELSKLNELLLKVQNENEMFELQSEDDIASVHFVRGRFLFMLNGKGLFSLKKTAFKDKLMFQIEKRNLKLVEDE
jgi:hypothetical protein